MQGIYFIQRAYLLLTWRAPTSYKECIYSSASLPHMEGIYFRASMPHIKGIYFMHGGHLLRSLYALHQGQTTLGAQELRTQSKSYINSQLTASARCRPWCALCGGHQAQLGRAGSAEHPEPLWSVHAQPQQTTSRQYSFNADALHCTHSQTGSTQHTCKKSAFVKAVTAMGKLCNLHCNVAYCAVSDPSLCMQTKVTAAALHPQLHQPELSVLEITGTRHQKLLSRAQTEHHETRTVDASMQTHCADMNSPNITLQGASALLDSTAGITAASTDENT
eukprot:659718-Pelagomonas_calceolata.AAC.1